VGLTVDNAQCTVGLGLMLKVCLAGKPLRSLIKATSEHTLPFLSPLGWSISRTARERS